MTMDEASQGFVVFTFTLGIYRPRLAQLEDLYLYPPTVSAGLAHWPLHDIAITNIVWCMAYKRGVRGASYIAQSTYNRIATVWAM